MHASADGHGGVDAAAAVDATDHDHSDRCCNPTDHVVFGCPDLVGAITAHVDKGDLYAWALGCRAFQAGQVASRRALRLAIGKARGTWSSLTVAQVRWVLDEMDIMITSFPFRQETAPLVARACGLAARAGDLEMLKWFRKKGCPWIPEYPAEVLWRFGTCDEAAWMGKLEVLEWARSQGAPWYSLTCACAARGGHLDVLQWARAQGCPWDAKTCAWAAYGGHLEVLQWARAQGCPWDARVCAEAERGGHLDVLRWARENGAPILRRARSYGSSGP
jgi:hypothetical protein